MKVVAQVNTICQDVSNTLQEMAFKQNYAWQGTQGKVVFNHKDRVFLQLGDDKRLYATATPSSDVKVSALEDFVNLLKVTVTIIRAGDYDVTVSPDKKSITANGITITKETVEEIWKRLN